MNRSRELKIAAALLAVFLVFYFLPVGTPRFDGAVTEALELTKWYAREHVVLCLLPAFWIAGAKGFGRLGYPLGIVVSQKTRDARASPRNNAHDDADDR